MVELLASNGSDTKQGRIINLDIQHSRHMLFSTRRRCNNTFATYQATVTCTSFWSTSSCVTTLPFKYLLVLNITSCICDTFYPNSCKSLSRAMYCCRRYQRERKLLQMIPQHSSLSIWYFSSYQCHIAWGRAALFRGVTPTSNWKMVAVMDWLQPASLRW